MKKKIIRLSESDLHNIINGVCQKIINESGVETGIEYYDKQREMYRALNNVRNLQAKAMQSLNELFEACEKLPDENIKLYIRPSVTQAIENLKNMFPNS